MSQLLLQLVVAVGLLGDDMGEGGYPMGGHMQCFFTSFCLFYEGLIRQVI